MEEELEEVGALTPEELASKLQELAADFVGGDVCSLILGGWACWLGGALISAGSTMGCLGSLFSIILV